MKLKGQKKTTEERLNELDKDLKALVSLVAKERIACTKKIDDLATELARITRKKNSLSIERYGIKSIR